MERCRYAAKWLRSHRHWRGPASCESSTREIPGRGPVVSLKHSKFHACTSLAVATNARKDEAVKESLQNVSG